MSPKGKSGQKYSGKKQESVAGRPWKKEVLLTVGFLLLSAFYLMLPENRAWIELRMKIYFTNMLIEYKHQDLEGRIQRRHGFNYKLPQHVFQQTTDSSVVLLPPKYHVRAQYSKKEFQWHHPIWHYYFFGPRERILYDPEKEQDLSEVTHAVFCKDGNVHLGKVESKPVLDEIIRIYRADLDGGTP